MTAGAKSVARDTCDESRCDGGKAIDVAAAIKFLEETVDQYGGKGR